MADQHGTQQQLHRQAPQQQQQGGQRQWPVQGTAPQQGGVPPVDPAPGAEAWRPQAPDSNAI